MDATSGPRPARFVVATDWTRPSVIAAALMGLESTSTSPAPVEIVLAVSHEPHQGDLDAAGNVLKAVGAPSRPYDLRLESFDECLTHPHDTALVTQGDVDSYALDLVRWCVRIAELDDTVHGAALSRPTNSGNPVTLQHALDEFKDIDDQPDAITPFLAYQALRPHSRGTYIGDGVILVRTSWNGLIAAPAYDPGRTPLLLTHGAVDEPLIRYIKNTVRRGRHLIHVGAGIGDETLPLGLATGLEGSVIATEANPLDLRLLRDNISRARLDSVVSVVDAELGCAPVGPPTRTSWIGTPLVDDPQFDPIPVPLVWPAATEIVRKVALDELVGDSKIDLVLVSAHGSELDVLRTGRTCLFEGQVRRLLLSTQATRLADDWGPYVAALSELVAAGWTSSVIADDASSQPVPVDAVVSMGGVRRHLLTAPS